MKAMILSAGKGTRLGSITESIPKALVDINGKSVLHIAVEKCTLSGFDDIIINVHHFADAVECEADHLRDLGYKISVSDEREMLLETGGGLYKAKNFFDAAPFLLYNVDIITDIDLGELLKYHNEKKGLATVSVRNRRGNRYFLIDSDNLLCGWCNHSTGEKIVSRKGGSELFEIAFSGIHIIDPEIFRYMKEGVYTMTKLYLDLASFNKIYAFKNDTGYWFDIGTPEILEDARKILGG